MPFPMAHPFPLPQPSGPAPGYNYAPPLRPYSPDLLNDAEFGADNGEDVTGATLAFVFDSTGSMWNELQQVKEGAKKITETMLAHPDKPIYDYLLVPFNDPHIGPVTQTTNHILFQERIASIDVFGGMDCPEMSVGGILKALELCRPNSYIYVVTDASAKDYDLASQVLALIQRKQAQVVFLLTGNCNGVNEPGYKVYETIAATSSGQVYDLNKTDVEEVLKFVRVSLQDQKQKVNLLSVDSPEPAKDGKDLPLQVDESLKEFTVSVSGANSKLKVTNPGGQQAVPPQLTPLLDLVNVKIVNVKEPDPGMWTLTIGSDSPHSVRSTGLSTLHFIHGFSVIPTFNMAETSHRPLKGAENSLLIKATEPENLFNLTEVNLIGFTGGLLAVIVLRPVQRNPGLYMGGPLIPPDDFFNLEIHGYGRDGFPIRRITPSAINAQLPDLPVINMKPFVTAWVLRPMKLKCSVESLVPITVMWFKNGVMLQNHSFSQTADVVLELRRVTQKDEGTFVCQAENVAGIVKRETHMTVLGPPPVVEMIPKILSEPGVGLTIPCNVSSPLEYNVSWTYSDSPEEMFSPGDLRPFFNSPQIMEVGPNLYNPYTQKSDEGWYVCTASSKGGRGSGKSYISIGKAPSLEVEPKGLKFEKGSKFTLSCRANGGMPKPALAWMKDGQLLNNVDEKFRLRYIGSDILELIIQNADQSDEGEYECVGSNSIAKVSEKVFVRYIEIPRIVYRNTAPRLARVGQAVKIQCTSTGVPRPMIQWVKRISSNPYEDQSMQVRQLLMNPNCRIVP